MGNSETTIKNHYRRLIQEDVANEVLGHYAEDKGPGKNHFREDGRSRVKKTIEKKAHGKDTLYAGLDSFLDNDTNRALFGDRPKRSNWQSTSTQLINLVCDWRHKRELEELLEKCQGSKNVKPFWFCFVRR